MTDATLRTDVGGLQMTLGGRALARILTGCVIVDSAAPAPVHLPAVDAVPADAEAGAEGVVAHDVSGRWHMSRIADQDVWEISLALRNDGDAVHSVTRMDPCAIRLDPAVGAWRTTWYRSAWGDEFRPRHGTTRHDVFLDVRSGRSSHGTVPWLGLETEDGGAGLIVTPAWSGNWHITALSGGDITAGISPWEFSVELQPGEEVRAPSVVLAAGADLEAASLALQRAVRDAWLPRTAFTDGSPTEWNHWWPYEDQEVDEEVIRANAREAGQLGIEVATVDAGWFGAADAASDWQEQRGDWALVNTERFPSGLSDLGAAIADAGPLPGIWIEAEAVGRSSRLRADRPEILALSTGGRRRDPSYRLMTVSLDDEDPTFLGYVCLGSADGRDHVLTSISDLITRFGARWVKLDFNIDPDAGCTRTDHGHGAGDGLLRHYEGLYDVLDSVRERHPDVLIESCSSGGLRIDLGLARHVHGFFLSDPDYTEHHLEVLAGASRMLPPLGILHWSQSQWRGDYPPQRLDWANLGVADFDTMLRAAMLHRFGVSLRLTELRPALRERLATHVELYRRAFAPLVRDGVLRTLTPPPERGGLGERAPVLQLTDEDGDRHIVAAFVLDGAERPDAVHPRGLRASTMYRVTDLTDDAPTDAQSAVRSGAVLMDDGVALDGTRTVSSWLFGLAPLS